MKKISLLCLMLSPYVGLFAQTCQNCGVNQSTPLSSLHVKGCGTTSATSAFRVDNSANTPLLFVRDDKNIGFGTITPVFKLELSGTSAISDRTIGINTIPVVYLPDQGGAIFNGSIAFGNGLRNLSGSSQGQYVTAVGIDALLANTTANYNTAVGYRAGYSITTGGNNVALGGLALYSNTTGTNNIAVGEEAMYSASGNYNIGFGTN